MAVSGFDIDAPRWDQSTFMGRLKHFVNITDWRTALLPDSRLDEHWWRAAASLPPGTTEEQLHYAKKLYDSAFHPDTGNRMNLIGRMSFQVPGEMAITGGMLQFYRKLLPWWRPGFHLRRWRQLTVNIPMMRQQELLNGIAVTDENGNKLGHSKKAALKRITQVVISRVTMAAPGMIILPIIMQRLEDNKFMQGAAAEVSVLESLACPNLVFMVTAACSQFSQQCSMGVSKLEPEVREAILSRYGDSVQNVYFYKGL